MADSLNYRRSKYRMVQTNRFVLRWFNLNEAPKETSTASTGAVAAKRRVSKMSKRSQREALKTKRKPSAGGVTYRGTENKTGLDEVGKKGVQPQAAVTVNLISRQPINSDEEMEDIGEDIEGEQREAAKDGEEEHDEPDGSFVETLDSFSESLSEISDELILLPNILVPCTKCGDVINICRLPCHRNLHIALQTLKYSQDQRPKNINALVRRRKLLIKQQQDASSKNRQDPFGDKHLHKLNTAFEMLRIELQGNTDVRYLADRIIEEIKLTGEGFDMSCTTAVGICEEANKRWKNMEDVHIYQDNFLNNVNSAFFAIYDGYSGKHTAEKCSRHLHVFLKEKLDSIMTQKQVMPTKKEVTAAFRSSFSKTERMLVASEEERSQSRWSGCSAVTCVLTDDTCFMADAGNVGAMLLRDNDIVKVLTHKHDLYNKKERERVKKSSGVIVKTEKCALINGALGVTRGIGNIGDTALKKCVINEPGVKMVPLVPSDQLLILASGGFWKMFSYEETTHLVNGFFGQIRKEAKQQIITGNKMTGTTYEANTEHRIEAEYHTELFSKTTDPINKFSNSSDFLNKSVEKLTHSKSEENLDMLASYAYHRDLFFTTTEANDSMNTDNELTYTNDMTYLDNDVKYDVTQVQYLRHHRFSLPDDATLQLLKGSKEAELTKPEKARLLAKCLAERLVKSALYAESMDNITVFVVLLPGFSMINWSMVTPDILGALNEFVCDDDVY